MQEDKQKKQQTQPIVLTGGSKIIKLDICADKKVPRNSLLSLDIIYDARESIVWFSKETCINFIPFVRRSSKMSITLDHLRAGPRKVIKNHGKYVDHVAFKRVLKSSMWDKQFVNWLIEACKFYTQMADTDDMNIDYPFVTVDTDLQVSINRCLPGVALLDNSVKKQIYLCLTEVQFIEHDSTHVPDLDAPKVNRTDLKRPIDETVGEEAHTPAKKQRKSRVGVKEAEAPLSTSRVAKSQPTTDEADVATSNKRKTRGKVGGPKGCISGAQLQLPAGMSRTSVVSPKSDSSGDSWDCYVDGSETIDVHGSDSDNGGLNKGPKSSTSQSTIETPEDINKSNNPEKTPVVAIDVHGSDSDNEGLNKGQNPSTSQSTIKTTEGIKRNKTSEKTPVVTSNATEVTSKYFNKDNPIPLADVPASDSNTPEVTSKYFTGKKPVPHVSISAPQPVDLERKMPESSDKNFLRPFIHVDESFNYIVPSWGSFFTLVKDSDYRKKLSIEEKNATTQAPLTDQ